MAEPIRVVIVDDERLFAELMRVALHHLLSTSHIAVILDKT